MIKLRSCAKYPVTMSPCTFVKIRILEILRYSHFMTHLFTLINYLIGVHLCSTCVADRWCLSFICVPPVLLIGSACHSPVLLTGGACHSSVFRLCF